MANYPCALTDCKEWEAYQQGCGGTAAWWLLGGTVLAHPVDVAHKCCGYAPKGRPELDPWYWPVPNPDDRTTPREGQIKETVDPETGEVTLEYGPEVPMERMAHMAMLLQDWKERKWKVEGV